MLATFGVGTAPRREGGIHEHCSASRHLGGHRIRDAEVAARKEQGETLNSVRNRASTALGVVALVISGQGVGLINSGSWHGNALPRRAGMLLISVLVVIGIFTLGGSMLIKTLSIWPRPGPGCGPLRRQMRIRSALSRTDWCSRKNEEPLKEVLNPIKVVITDSLIHNYVASAHVRRRGRWTFRL
jgi:hypothetical protein